MLQRAAIFLICMFYSHALWAANPWDGSAPIYDPDSKSYFQLFSGPRTPNWAAAKAIAATKVFKGVRGRLAVIDTVEKHEFIMKKFGMNWREASVWIGLRYWCSVRMLQWEGGRLFSPSDTGHFRLWHGQWARDEGTNVGPCAMAASLTQGFAPVYYRNIGGVVRWQAVGAGKGFANYLVEYTTNGE